MKVLKILFYADRECLKQVGRPITGDTMCAMKYGPVLSNTLDLIRDRASDAQEWGQWIVTEHRNVRLARDPGNDELSPFEIDILHEMWDKYKDIDPFDLANDTHDLLEWKKNEPPPGSSKRIPFEDILESVGRTDVDGVAEEARTLGTLDRLYG